MKKLRFFLYLFALSILVGGCATESSKAINVPKVEASNTPYHGKKAQVSIGRFNNQSSYNNGIFSDGEDRLGNQAQTILITSL